MAKKFAKLGFSQNLVLKLWEHCNLRMFVNFLLERSLEQGSPEFYKKCERYLFSYQGHFERKIK